MFFTNTGGLMSSHDTHGDEEISLESMQIINESLIMNFLTEEEQDALLESPQEYQGLINADIVQENTIVRLSKKDRISQIQKVAVFTIAKEKSDPLFKKLLTVWRMEKTLEGKLFDKYHSEGLRRARKTVQANYRQKGNAFVKINDRSTKAIGKAARGQSKKSTLV